MSCVAFKPDDPNILASGCHIICTINVWDITSGSCLPVSDLSPHSESVLSVSWSPCGQWLASGGADEMVYIHDAKTLLIVLPQKKSQALAFWAMVDERVRSRMAPI